MVRPMLCLLLVVATFTPGNSLEASPAVLYVAPAGGDTNPGTEQQPLASLEAARDAARKAGDGPHRIVITPGEYFLTKPLELDARDNGLTIEAGTGGKVTLYGGKVVSGWRPDGDRFWCADLPDVKEGSWDFRALVVNGRMPDRARFPGSGTFLNQGTWNLPLLPAVSGFWERKPTQEELTTMPYDPKDIPASLDVKNAEVRMYHMWSDSLVGVARNDLERHALIFSSPAVWPAGALGLKKYVIYNTQEGMTQPGQWYLDRTAGRIVYWPLPGEDMARAKVVAPMVEQIIRIAGTAKKKAEKITVRGLTLQATTMPLKPASFGAGGLDGALSIAQADQCVFEGLEICNVGGLGIAAQQFSGSRIGQCHVHHVGACGVRLDASETLVSGNHIHHVGVYYPGAAAAMFYGRSLRVCRNEIHDAPYSGIIGGGKDHVFEENLIYRVMREMHDGAAIYGNLVNCTIRRNVVRDVAAVGTGFGASAYYLDEGASDCIVERNVSIGVGRPTHNHIARNVAIRDNVFIADKDMQLSFQKSANCTFERNTLVAPGKVSVGQPNAIKVWKDNILFSNGLGKDDQPHAFTIDDAMPPVATPARKTYSAEAVRAAKTPTLDGEITLEEWPGRIQSLDREPSRHTACGAPVFVKLAYDDQFLYVAVTVTMFEPAKLSTGSTWGKHDGVEICLAGQEPDARPTTFVVRGYVNGTTQSVVEGGASQEAAARLAKELRFAAKPIKGRGDNSKGWRAEWAIPFAALGWKPTPGQKVPFNMGVYGSEFDQWHCWEGTLAENWRLDQAGMLLIK